MERTELEAFLRQNLFMGVVTPFYFDDRVDNRERFNLWIPTPRGWHLDKIRKHYGYIHNHDTEDPSANNYSTMLRFVESDAQSEPIDYNWVELGDYL